MLGSFNKYPDLDIDVEDTVNLFEIRDPKIKEQRALLSTPGLKFELNVSPGSTDPVRALFVFETMMYGVFGSNIYGFNSNLTPIFLGTIDSNAGGVSITNNNGGQVIFVDGEAGYIYTPTTGVFAKITDPDFPAKPINVVYLDTYFAIPSGETQTFQLSANNDGTQWNAFLDEAQIQTYPGVNRGVGVVNERLFFFKDTSTEVWWNPGAADFPLRKDTNLNFNYGCLSEDSIDSQYGYLLWLSQDKSGPASVMMTTGYVPQRVSTKAIESTIAKFTKPDDVIAYIYKDEGRIFYVMNWTTDDYTLVLDVESAELDPNNPLWHRMEMLPKPPLEGNPNYSKTRHVGNCHAYFNNVHYVGSYKEPILYSFSRSYADNAGEPIRRIRTGKPFFDPRYRYQQINLQQIDIQPGLGTVDNIYDNPVALLSISRDGGQVFGNKQAGSIGRIGMTQTRCLWRKKGLARSYVPRLEISASIAPICIMGDMLDYEGLSQ